MQISVNLSASTTGYFITKCFNPGTVVSWGAFQSNNVPNGGALSYWVSTGTTCGSVQAATATWTAQNVNTNISVATAAYIGVRVLFNGWTTYTTSSDPVLNDITINWTSTSGRPRAASQVFDNRYWLAYTTNTSGSGNDSVLVYDQLGHWSKFTGINAGTLLTYNRSLYAGLSDGTGRVAVENTGSTDFGSPILFDFRSPDYELNSFTPVSLYDLNLEFGAVSSVYSPSLAVTYFVDRGTTPYSIGTVPLTTGRPGLRYSTHRFGQGSDPTRVNTISFELKDSSTAPLTFYRSRIRFTPEDGP